MSFVIIFILSKTEEDKISSYKLRGIYNSKNEAINMCNLLRNVTDNIVILIPDITLQDIPFIKVSGYFYQDLTYS